MAKFNMPQLGETVSEGTITRWLKKEGDHVEADEALVEISTDKVDSEIPSPETGVLAKILAQEGETVPVGAGLAEIAQATEPDKPDGSGPVSTEVQAKERPPAGSEESAVDGAGEDGRKDREPVPASPGKPAGRTGENDSGAGGKVFSPLVRRLAADKGIDLGSVPGTGSGGRVTREDVMRFVQDGAASSAVTPGGSPKVPGGEPVQPAAPATGWPKTGEGNGGRETTLPLTNMRRLIAQHMVHSVNETARAWNTVEVDMSAVGKLRKAAAQRFKATHGFSLTWTPFVARALTQALREFPQVNSSWNGDGTITHKHYVNLGIAVALENGLIVPVVKGADEMNLIGLAQGVRDVAEKARQKKLSADDIKQGTFTLTNPGPFGSVLSVPIINRGEAAILAFDAIVKRPVVVTDPDGNDSIGIREMVFLSLSWDHRLIDGAEAAQFLSRLKSLLELADFKSDLAPYLQ